MNGREDLYIVLEVGRAASVNDIKKAFRKLARRYHPDINPGDRTAEDRFKRISEAYEILSDPLKRRFYDDNGFYTEGVLVEKTGAAQWGFGFASGLGEIFGQVLTQQAVRRQPERGSDLEYQISVSFDDAIRGVSTKIGVLRKAACHGCHGNGRMAGSRDIACTRCAASGKASIARGLLQFAVNCPDCGGMGRKVTECRECGGEGRLSTNESIDVNVPPGVSTGSRIRYPEKGDSGRLGGPAGDLYVVTNVAAHPFFTRVGANIHCTVPITIAEAALGSKIEVPTIEGPAVVRVPPGTQNRQTFRLRGKGAPSLIDPSARGDQYVEVKVVIPRVGDERSKEILREFARLNPENPRREIWK